MLRHAVDGGRFIGIHSRQARMAGFDDFGKEGLDPGRQGGAEAHGLPAARFGRQRVQNLCDGGQEAGFEHLVGFVEHQRADGGELVPHVVVGEVVVQAAGGGDDDFGVAVAEALQRGFLGCPAVRGVALEARLEECGHGVAFFGDLQRQLARRGEDEDGHLSSWERRLREERLQCGQQEGDGLAGAGLCLDDAVGLEGRQLSEDFVLDRCHELVAHGL